jgi:hypothetical protein
MAKFLQLLADQDRLDPSLHRHACMKRFHHLTIEDASRLIARVEQIEKLRRPVIGYPRASADRPASEHRVLTEDAVPNSD